MTMSYVRLGQTGLRVSRICLGCMSYGDPQRGTHAWTLDEAQSRPFFRRALDLGINFFDTANVYSLGSSEELLGSTLLSYAPREELVIATKVHGRMRADANGAGLSRKALFTEIDHSLRRLRTDYVDLYQIHRWDPRVPIEETLEALNDLVRMGKVRYIGASSMFAWQFMKALAISRERGWARFVSMQNHLNLLYREEEREMLPLCESEGIGVLPWSPLARGRLTRDWSAHSRRQELDEFGKTLYGHIADADQNVVQAVATVAAARTLSRAQVALAWVLHKRPVTAPIIGATKLEHLDDAVAALSLELSDEERKTLEAPYVPHDVAGHS
jgi:1-deoxyxylulose-5-phosphate synthase